MSKFKVSCDCCKPSIVNGVATHESRCPGRFTFTRGARRYVNYVVWSLDAWGNEKEGFEVNDRSRNGTIMVPIDNWGNVDENALIRVIKRVGMWKRNTRMSSFLIDGDEESLFVNWAKTAEPLYQLERI